MLIENPMETVPLLFPFVELFHISGFIMTIGTIALVDFRLLNLGMRHQTPAQLAEDTGSWTLAGLILVICSGLLLYSSDPDMYYLNLSFQLKLVCLTLAIVFHYAVQRRVVASGASPGKGKLVAILSLALWASVLFGGIFIGFTENGLTF